MNTSPIKSCFPYFGGKSKIAKTIWSAFGEVSNYVEPFAGSLAVLLANPIVPKIETINDINHFLANFWRSTSIDPQSVIKYADYPVNEADLHARHAWLVSSATDDFKAKMITDPHYFDAKIAGYWVWGQSASVGNNWLQPKGLKALPLLSSAGSGIHGLTYSVEEWIKILHARTRRTRVCCGDWSRVVTPSVTYNNVGIGTKDITGVFLDPPYLLKGRDKVYDEDKNIFQEVCQWAVANGDNPRMRIALCGYEGNHGIPDSWRIFAWKTGGGLANLGNNRGKDNASKERIWFSPHCLVKE